MNSFSENIVNGEEIIHRIEQFDLRNLKNNYYTDRTPENFKHWEITYNNHFKIVGTYDQEIEEFKRISEELNFKMLIENEPLKIQDMIKNNRR